MKEIFVLLLRYGSRARAIFLIVSHPHSGLTISALFIDTVLECGKGSESNSIALGNHNFFPRLNAAPLSFLDMNTLEFTKVGKLYRALFRDGLRCN
jgi:hypothetical protein